MARCGPVNLARIAGGKVICSGNLCMANPTNVSRAEPSKPSQAKDEPHDRLPMRKDKLLILFLFVLAVGVAVGIQQFQQFYGGASRDGPGGRPDCGPLKPVKVSQFRGFALQLQSADPNRPYKKFIDEIADTGANTVCLVVAAYQENCSSTSIFVDARRSVPDGRLRKLIAHAHARKLRVVLMPIVLLDNPRADEWRGRINPDSWDDWWEKYNGYILQYARIAQQADAEVFVLGSELVSTEKDHAARWRALIRRVRNCYKGYLSYSANWDHYRPISWWNDLDIIGMTTYYDLTGGKKPTVSRLVNSWRPIKREILEWQSKINRPILFTEVGWPNQVTCAQFPWDYTRSPERPDPAAQANCFDAFFRTWIREKAVAGFLVWEWRSHPRQRIGPEDPSYVPCGKPALEVIKKHYQAPAAATKPAK